MAGDLLQVTGLGWVFLIALISGIVYGFAGFGAALIFMPVATIFLPIETAVAAFAVSAIASLLTVVPRAWGQADRKGVSLMILIAAVTLPIGLYILRSNDVAIMRWAVLAVACLTLIALMSGWRYTAKPTLAMRSGVAAATGLVGGATGLVGPVMILFQLSGQDSVARSRANTIVFLTFTGFLTAPLMYFQGMLSAEAVAIGLFLILPYGVGARIGQALFDPTRQVLYRNVAYGIIFAAIVLGLPVTD